MAANSVLQTTKHGSSTWSFLKSDYVYSKDIVLIHSSFKIPSVFFSPEQLSNQAAQKQKTFVITYAVLVAVPI